MSIAAEEFGSAKDRKHVQHIEKVLASFDTLDEWADYISFLSRLQKALQLHEGLPPKSIPRTPQVANKLSLCLSLHLPNGVHQKTLSIYKSVFSTVSHDALNRDVAWWLQGLFPLLSYCSIQLKPQWISLFKQDIFPVLSEKRMRLIIQPMVLALMPGLDDENADTFLNALDLMDSLKLKVNDDSFFWLHISLCIIHNPERRLGALHLCSRILPILGPESPSKEAQACMSSEPGLLVRAFASAISQSLTDASPDIVVVRGFFDLLLSHMPLHSKVYNDLVTPRDVVLLVLACSRVALRKDMGLNRRLWQFFLGPDQKSDQNSGMTSYFELFALEPLKQGLFAQSNDPVQLCDAIKISLQITFEKWEIRKHISKELVVVILNRCYEFQDNEQLLKAALVFFDGVEPALLWKYVSEQIREGNCNLVLFLVQKFSFNYEEVTLVHIPLAILRVLAANKIDPCSLTLLESLLNAVSPSAYSEIDGQHETLEKSQINELLDQFYYAAVTGDSVPSPLSPGMFSYVALEFMCQAYAENLTCINLAPKLSKNLCIFLSTVQISGEFNWYNDQLTTVLVSFAKNSPMKNEPTVARAIVALGISNLMVLRLKLVSDQDTKRLLKSVMIDLWPSVTLRFPALYQMEATRALLDLYSILPFHVQAGVLCLFKSVPDHEKANVFTVLWSLSGYTDANLSLLAGPLEMLVDSMSLNTGCTVFALEEFIEHSLGEGTTSRLLKLLSIPFLEFDFLRSEETVLTTEDDLQRLLYFLGNVNTFIEIGKRDFGEFLKSEPVAESLDCLVDINSTVVYKTFFTAICLKIISFEWTSAFTVQDENLQLYFECLEKVYRILKSLITGAERGLANQFYSVTSLATFIMKLETGSPVIKELIVTKALDLATFYLDVANTHKIRFVDDSQLQGPPEKYLADLFTHGIRWTQSNGLLAQWRIFLTHSLYVLEERVFTVLNALNDAILEKLNANIEIIALENPVATGDGIDGALHILLSCLEDLLLISYSISGSRTKGSRHEKNSSEIGFFSNVIQGVFQIEAPAFDTQHSDPTRSVLAWFQSAVDVCFKIWVWGDAKSAPTSSHVGKVSLNHLAHKLKFRAKRFLESLLGLEKQQVIETLIKLDPNHECSCKLLTIIDGGRYQQSLDIVIDSIVSRCAPNLYEDKKKSLSSVSIHVDKLSSFMLYHVEKLDTNNIDDVWNTCIQYFRQVSSNPDLFSIVLADCLKLAVSLATHLITSKISDKKKMKKELADEFTRLLTAAVSHEYLLQDAGDESDPENLVTQEDSDIVLYTTLFYVVPKLSIIYDDNDKVVSCLNIIMSYAVAPPLKNLKIDKVPTSLVTLILAIGKVHQSNQWKTLVADAFTDPRFFNHGVATQKRWDDCLFLWAGRDTERFPELVQKATTLASTPSNIFRNEALEVQARVAALGRLTYIIMIAPKNQYLVHLELLFSRIEYSMTGTRFSSYKAQLFNLFRAISLKFDPMFLLPYWTLITQDLVSAFSFANEHRSKGKADFSSDELYMILCACKLLDQLLVLGFDDFNLSEWLFTTSSPEVAAKALNVGNTVALIDKISQSRLTANFKDTPVMVESPTENMRPLLFGVRKVFSISELRLFFDNLGWINYERIFGLYHFNESACNEDVVADLFEQN